jgi:Skp family chaperone for outer membrane proteins
VGYYLIRLSILMHAGLSVAAATSTVEDMEQTMGFRDLAKAVSRAVNDKERAALKRALEKRKEELQKAQAAVEEALADLSAAAKKAGKRGRSVRRTTRR